MEQKEKEGDSCSNAPSRPDAFDILMNSQLALQRSRMSRQLPKPVDECNKEDTICCCSWN